MRGRGFQGRVLHPQVAESTKDELLGAEVLYNAACLHGCKGEKQEGLDCLQKAAAVASTQKPEGSLIELNALISLVNIAATESLEADFLSAVEDKEVKLFQDKPSTVSNRNGTLVMPCCRTRVGKGSCGAVLDTGFCPGCGRHACGRRCAGLPVCKTCLGDPEQ